MSAGADVGSALAQIVGGEHVLGGPAAAPYAIDDRTPRWVVFPATAEDVSRCLRLASAHALAVAPTGRGTRLHWGASPRALDLVLSLRRLDRILGHEPADMTVSVEAGVTVGALQAHIGPHRQLFPLDPARAGRSTIGGIIATTATGPYRARYGTIRDLVLGVTVVTADGTLVKGGGRVVKNVTGYDMPKLHVGALGTLGVVVSAHLRLHPRPEAETTWLYGFASAESALQAALGITDAPVVVSRLQLVDRATLGGFVQGATPEAALAVTVGSVREGVRVQGARVTEICGRVGGVAIELAEADGWWDRVREAAWPARPDDLAVRVGVRPTDVVKAFRAVEAAGRSAVECRATAEVPNGVVHLTLTGAGLGDAGGLLARIRGALAPLDGTCVVEHAPPAVKRSLDVWGDVGPALEVMRRLKAELDPQGLLNPGRFVGGI